jgi:hypothetical protein
MWLLTVLLLLPTYAFILVCFGAWFFGRAGRFSTRDLLVAMTAFAVLLAIFVVLTPRIQ